jgi:large subunit ribosomal protein L2
LTTKKPLKSLTKILKKHAGRNSQGRVTTRGQGGQSKRLYREIDFKRNKFSVPGKVASIEYDPNRTSFIALINYADGDKRYILAPEGLKVGDKVISDQKAPLKPGNTMPIASMPVGTVIHNVELQPGAGGKMARSAGSSVTLVAKDSGQAHLRLPSGEVRLIEEMSLATVGVLSNQEWKNIHFGKAGRKRNMGIRPTVRGVAQDPGSHPHGGGEGRSGIGMKHPKTPWGKPALGFRTRAKKKYSNTSIVKRRGTK